MKTITMEKRKVKWLNVIKSSGWVIICGYFLFYTLFTVVINRMFDLYIYPVLLFLLGLSFKWGEIFDFYTNPFHAFYEEKYKIVNT